MFNAGQLVADGRAFRRAAVGWPVKNRNCCASWDRTVDVWKFFKRDRFRDGQTASSQVNNGVRILVRLAEWQFPLFRCRIVHELLFRHRSARGCRKWKSWSQCSYDVAVGGSMPPRSAFAVINLWGQTKLSLIDHQLPFFFLRLNHVSSRCRRDNGGRLGVRDCEELGPEYMKYSWRPSKLSVVFTR